MDKEVIAVPFKPFDPDSDQDSSPDQDNETWTVLTKVYLLVYWVEIRTEYRAGAKGVRKDALFLWQSGLNGPS